MKRNAHFLALRKKGRRSGVWEGSRQHLWVWRDYLCHWCCSCLSPWCWAICGVSPTLIKNKLSNKLCPLSVTPGEIPAWIHLQKTSDLPGPENGTEAEKSLHLKIIFLATRPDLHWENHCDSPKGHMLPSNKKWAPFRIYPPFRTKTAGDQQGRTLCVSFSSTHFSLSNFFLDKELFTGGWEDLPDEILTLPIHIRFSSIIQQLWID